MISLLLCESNVLQSRFVWFPTRLVHDVKPPHKDPINTLNNINININTLNNIIHDLQRIKLTKIISFKVILTHNDPSHLNLMTEHQPVEVLELFCMNTVVAPVGVAIPIPVELGHL